ncbi:TPA: hypothetical protein RD775_000794, partial [Enterococcus faecium]|nr:hypothetical protein [Enterococcus faecium]
MADIVQLKEDGVAKYLKTHAKGIDGVEGVLVKATGNETVLGTKNFKDGLQFNGLPVQAGMIERAITLADRSDTTNVTDVNGKIIRIGNIVFLTFNFKCGTWPEGSETR